MEDPDLLIDLRENNGCKGNIFLGENEDLSHCCAGLSPWLSNKHGKSYLSKRFD